MAEVLFRAKLVREDASQPWGFRLQGGADYNKPLTLLKVMGGSVAARCGLQPGDIVVKMAGQSADHMTHKDAQHTIVNAGNIIEILVERCDEDQSLSPSSSSDEEEAEDILYADLAPPATPQPNLNLKKAILSDGAPGQQLPLQVQPVEATSQSPSQTVSQPTSQQSASEPVTQQASVAQSNTQPLSNSETVVSTQQQVSTTTSQVSSSIKDSQYSPPSLDVDPKLEGNGNHSNVPVVDPSTSATNIPASQSSNATHAQPPPYKHVDLNSNTLTLNGSAKDIKPDNNVQVTPAPSSVAVGNHVIIQPKADDNENSGSGIAENNDLLAQQQPTVIRTSTNVTVQNNVSSVALVSKELPVAKDTTSESVTGLTVTPVESNVVMTPVTDEPSVPWRKTRRSSAQSSPPVIVATSDNNKATRTSGYDSDTTHYSKTAPWRVGKQQQQMQPPSESDSGPHSPQWRLVAKDKERQPKEPAQAPGQEPTGHLRSVSLPVQHFHSSDPGSLAASRSYDSIQEETEPKLNQAPISVIEADPKLKPSLTFLGKRIESPVSSPVTKAGPFFQQQTSANNSKSTSQNGSKAYYPPPPGSGPQPLPLPANELKELRKLTNAEFHPLKAEDITFSSADPDLMGLSMPAVKEMVNDLNRRLEAIAAQHPKIVVKEEMGTVFKKNDTLQEREIFIDSAPVEDMGLYAPLLSPGSLSPRSAQRRVHFAEPLESSVIEIEPQSRRRIMRVPSEEEMTEAGPVVYSSAKTLAATLDRIERENAMSSMQFRNTVSNVSTPVTLTTTSSSKRTPVSVVHTTTTPDKPKVDFKSSGKGFSFSIGKGPPGHQINVSMLQQAPGTEPTRLAFHIPPTVPGGPRQFTYSISRPPGSKEPFTVRYDLPPSYEESMRTSQQRAAAQMMSPPPPPPQVPQPSMSPVMFLEQPSPRLSPQPRYTPSPSPPPMHPYLAGAMPQPGITQAGLYPHPDPSKPLHIQTLPPRFSPQPMPHRFSPQPQPPVPVASPLPFLDDDQLTQSRSFRLLEARFNNAVAAGAVGGAGGSSLPPRRASVPSSPLREQPQYTGQVPQPAATARPYMPATAAPDVPAMRAFMPGPESPMDLYTNPQAVKAFESMPGLFCLFDKDFTDKFMHWQSHVGGGFRQSETAKLVQEMDEESRFGNNQ